MSGEQSSKIGISSGAFANPVHHWIKFIKILTICLGKLTFIGLDYFLSPGRRHAIISNNAGTLLIGTVRTNFSENLIEIHVFYSTKGIWKCRLEMVAILSRPRCVKLCFAADS